MAKSVSQSEVKGRVSGTISFADGRPVYGFLVRAVDRSVGDQRELGAAITDDTGHYGIPYSTAELSIAGKTAADVEIRVFASDGKRLATSALHPMAPAELTVSLTLDFSPPVPSEYELLLSAIEPHLGKAQLADLTVEDVDYLAQVTGRDAKKIERLAASARCSRTLAEAKTAPIPDAVIYALTNHGLASDPSALLREPVYRLTEALNRAVSENIISPPDAEAMAKLSVGRDEGMSDQALNVVPSGEEGDWPNLVADAFRQIRVEQELRPAEQGQRLSVADLFAAPATVADGATTLSADKQRALAALIAASPDDVRKIEASSLEELGFERIEIATVQRQYALADLTRQHRPLVDELSALAVGDASAPSGDLSYLAELQLSDWQGLVEKSGVPPDIEGDDDVTRQATYAATLESGVETAHRTSVIAARIRQERLSVPEKGRGDLNTFFQNNPDFEFGKQYVQVLLAEDGNARLDGIEDPTTLKHNLAALERTVKLTDNHRQQSTLLADGLDSAQKMARIGRRDVLARLTAHPDVGEDAAKAIFARAEHTAAMATALFMRYREYGINLPVLQPGGAAVQTSDAVPAAALRQVPDLATLFGSLDSCACESCQSVLSPAAYFVDILKYLEDRKSSSSTGAALLDVLLGRRPDLMEIELSCANSNTLVSYLGLVLEILESEAGTRFPHRIELSGSGLSAVVSDLNSGKITLALSNAIKSFSPAVSMNASVEVVDQGDWTIWTVRDSSCRLSMRYDSMGHEMFLDSYAPQTPDVAESAGTSPEHFNVTAYEALKSAVYPVGLPYDLWNDDAGQNLKFSGTPLHALMTLFYRDTGWAEPELGGPGVRHWRSAVERLGFSATEVDIIAGTRLGARESTDPNYGPWNFWGLTGKDLNIGNSIPDPADSTRRIESGTWPNVLTDRIDVLMQQSGLSYEELRQMLDMRFVNMGAGGAPILAIKLGAIDYGSIELLRRQISFDHTITLATPSGEGEYSELPNSSSSFVVLASTRDAVLFRFGDFQYSHLSSGLTIAIDVRFVLDGQPLEARRFTTPGPWVIAVPGPALTAGTHTISIEARVVRISGDPTEVKTVRVFGAATLVARLETESDVKSLTCDLSKAKLERLGAPAQGDLEAVLHRMHRFIRLWRKLGWPMPDVDRALLLAKVAIDDSIPFEVYGVVTDPQGQALAGVVVSAVDQDVAGENTLGNATTDELGGYRIVFAASDYRKTASEVGGPDLILRLNDSHRQSLGQSRRRRNATRSTEINLRADVAARVVTDLSAASDNSDAHADGLAAIEWTRNYLTERLGIADQFLDPGRLDTKRYVDFGKPGQPELPSPYENVYLRPGLTPPPEAFELKAGGNEIRGEGKPCTDYVAHIASACGLSVMDAHRLIADGETTLSLHALSRLYFSARLVRVAGLSIWEFIELRKLCTDIIPYSRTATLDSVVSDVAMSLKEAGMPAAEAIWLLSHRSERDVSDAERRQIVTLLTEIRATLARVYAETAQTAEMFDPDEHLIRQELQYLNWDSGVITDALGVLSRDGTLNTSDQDIASRHLCYFAVIDHSATLDEALASTLTIPQSLSSRCFYDRATGRLHFLGSMPQTDHAQLIALSTDTDYQRAVATLRDVRNNRPDNAEVFVDDILLTSLVTSASPAERYALLLPVLLSHRRRMYASVAVADHLASAFGFETRTAQRLISEWIATAATGRNSRVKALEDFLDPAFVESSPELPVSAENFPNAYRTCVRLAKVRTLMERLSSSEATLAWVFAPSARVNAWLDPNTFPASDDETDASLKGLLRLFNLVRLRDGIPGGEATLDAIFRLATDGKTSRDTLLERLSALTGWNLTDLRQMTGPDGFDLAADTDVRRSLAGEWVLWRLVECFGAMKRLGATAAQCLRWANHEIGAEEAAQISGLARSRHGEADWAEVIKPIRAARRERQRQALVSYLLAKKQMRGSNDLYSHYLIDVEMSPCAMTSRIKQACASVQLFVQRCLLNLEPDVPPSSIDTQLWGWMKNYRVWEANRKVFLYPENWIEPELRDDKSEFFRQLESDLLQSNVTHTAGLEAFKHYIEKLGVISRITVISMVDELLEGSGSITHVLGRDGSAPHRYFYRQWRIPPNSDAGYWTAWEEVTAGIDGNHVMLFVQFSSVRIAWPTITPEGTSGCLKITMNVVQRMASGWSAPKRGQDELWWTPPPNIDECRGLHFHAISSTTETAKIVCKGATFPEGATPRPFTFSTTTPLPTKAPYNQRGLIRIGCLTRYKDRFAREHFWRPSDVLFNGKVSRIGTLETPGGNIRLSDAPYSGNFSSVTLDLLPHLPEAQYRMDKLIAGIIEADIPSGYTLSSNISESVDTSESQSYLWDGDFIFDIDETKARSFVDPERDLRFFELGVFELSPAGVLKLEETLSYRPTCGDHKDSGVLEDLPFVDVQYFNSGFREKIGTQRVDVWGNKRNDLSLASLKLALLNTTPGRFSICSKLPTPSNPRDVFSYTDDWVDLTFWNKGSGATYRILPLSAWWCGMLASFTEKGSLAKAVAVQWKSVPTEQDLNIGPGVDRAWPTTMEIRFDRYMPLYVYNWETFFHIPILVATQLTQNQRHEEAQRWFHLVFDPTIGDFPSDPTRFWRFKPFHNNPQSKLSVESDLLALAAGDARLSDLIADWRQHPFQPHLIARTRIRVYQIFVVLKYLENLIAWGDQLFRRDTIESINEATQYFILASEILGRRPRRISTPTKRRAKTYRELPILDDFSNALVQLESILPAGGSVPGGGAENVPPLFSLYFCIPQNEKLTSYWDTVEDRLFKIRYCMNIEGIERQLALYEPPIDPALLVRATASGLDIASVLADLQTPLPRYRFNVMAQRAQDVAGDVKAFGAAVLTALEKQDGESLALLRSTQELALLKLVTLVRTGQHEEALANVASLRKTRELISQRYLQYQHLLGNASVEVPAANSIVTPEVTPLKAAVTRDGAIGDLAGLGLSKSEVDHLGWMNVANNYTITSGSFQTASSIGHFIPEIQSGTPFLSTKFGGGNIGNALGAFGSLFAMLSSNASFQGTRAATIGGHQRRFDEWALQSNLAAKELEQIDKQIAAAELRVAIAEQELKNHQKQIDNAQAVDDFMHDKFTNLQLYRWMSGQVASLYFRAYQLAYDLAKRAEKAYRHELGLEDKDSNFIQFGYWDSLKRGLLAGEKLSFDIRRMEAAYLEKNQREFEIAKHVSLRRLAPDQLVLLRSTGECTFDIPEWLFDLDGPGHYLRRLKTVSLSVPCVVGPYTGVHCKFTLLKSEVRMKPIASSKIDYPRKPREAGDDARFIDYPGAIEAMVTSGGSNDSGLFETNLRDERYLPFEGSGAISTWRIELPDPSLARFDYKTISDIVLHLRYTARDGGKTLRQHAQDSAKDQLQKVPGVLLISVKDEFPTEWARAAADPDGVPLELTLTTNMLPYVLSKDMQRKSVQLFDATKVPNTGMPVGFKTLENENGGKPLESPIMLGALTALKEKSGGAEPILLVELG